MDDNVNAANNMENENKEEVAAGEAKDSGAISKDARMWGMFCHLAGLCGYIIPFGNILGPLIIWQLKKEDSFVDDQGKEALNFQISIMIYVIVSALLMFLCIGIFLLIAVAIFNLVFLLIAAIKANDGESYRYPLTIRLIK